MSLRYPPGPKDWCFGLRTMSWLKSDVLGSYRDLHRRYGDIVYTPVGPHRLYMFFHPDQIHDVLVTHSKAIIRAPRVMQVFRQWYGDSSLIAEGEEWIRTRRLASPGFQTSHFDNYGRIITGYARELGQIWQTDAATNGSVAVNTRQAFTKLILKVIGKSLFGVDLTVDVDAISRAADILSEVAYHEMQAAFTMPLWWPTNYYRRKRWAIQTIDEVVWRIVRKRRTDPIDHSDVLSMLLAAVDQEGAGGKFTDRHARNEVITLLVAGEETSVASLEWLFYELARHPEIMVQCHTEIDAVLGDREATAADLARMPYLQAVIKETLRLYSPAIGVFTRQAARDVNIGGYDVPEGSLILLSSLVTQRDPRWFPDPDRFDPQRFLSPNPDELPQGAYFPFGAGSRICVGQAFAMLELTLIAATLLQHATLELPSGFDDPQPFPHLALRPKQPITLIWKPR